MHATAQAHVCAAERAMTWMMSATVMGASGCLDVVHHCLYRDMEVNCVRTREHPTAQAHVCAAERAITQMVSVTVMRHPAAWI